METDWAKKVTYGGTSLRVRMHRPTRTYASACAYIRVALRGRTCRSVLSVGCQFWIYSKGTYYT